MVELRYLGGKSRRMNRKGIQFTTEFLFLYHLNLIMFNQSSFCLKTPALYFHTLRRSLILPKLLRQLLLRLKLMLDRLFQI